MSIEAVLRKEHKKLTTEMQETKRLLETIERTMKEYDIWVYPDNQTVTDMIMDYLNNHGGHARFDEMYNYLEKRDIHLQKQRLSLLLNKNPLVYFNSLQHEWEIVDNPFRMAA